MATTAGLAASSAQPAAYRRLVELLMGSRITMGLGVAVEHKLPDLLGDDRKSVDELASEAGIPAASLRRLMRSLSYIGVFQEQDDGRFSNSEVSAYLRSDAEPSLREMSFVLKVHYDEGVAIHIGPKPCAGIREGVGEASAGERIGQPLSRGAPGDRLLTTAQPCG
jgi:hypothetical protein